MKKFGKIAKAAAAAAAAAGAAQAPCIQGPAGAVPAGAAGNFKNKLHFQSKCANIFPVNTDVFHRHTENGMAVAGGQHGR